MFDPTQQYSGNFINKEKYDNFVAGFVCLFMFWFWLILFFVMFFVSFFGFVCF